MRRACMCAPAPRTSLSPHTTHTRENGIPWINDGQPDGAVHTSMACTLPHRDCRSSLCCRSYNEESDHQQFTCLRRSSFYYASCEPISSTPCGPGKDFMCAGWEQCMPLSEVQTPFSCHANDALHMPSSRAGLFTSPLTSQALDLVKIALPAAAARTTVLAAS